MRRVWIRTVGSKHSPLVPFDDLEIYIQIIGSGQSQLYERVDEIILFKTPYF